METSKKATILIVDDTPQNLQLLGNIIYEQGYNVRIASSGDLALKSVSNLLPDLILLDIQMPDMDGFEVCKILKSDTLTKDIPIIFLTAVTDSEKILHGFELGAVDYITKPFNKGELLARVATHVELKFAREKLVELNTSKDKFFSIIGHDLRNPAYALKMLLKQITSKFSTYSNEELLYYLNGLYDTSENLHRMLDELLMWSKSQWGGLVVQRETLYLPDIIDKKIEQCKAAASTKNIEIKSTIDTDLYVNADEMMLNTVIINLLSNAIKFSKIDGIIEVDAIPKDKHIEISIKDSGMGMDESDLNKLFSIVSEVNLRGSNKEEVSGLGLILCKDFTERNGGTIYVKSEKDKGSTFSFTVKRELEMI